MCSPCFSPYWQQRWDQIPLSCINQSIQRVCANCKSFFDYSCPHRRSEPPCFQAKKRKLIKSFCQNKNCGKVMELCRGSQCTPQLLLFILLTQTFNRKTCCKLMSFLKGITSTAEALRIIEQSEVFGKDDATRLLQIMTTIKNMHSPESVRYDAKTKKILYNPEKEPISYSSEQNGGDRDSVDSDGYVNRCLRAEESPIDLPENVYDPEADLLVDPNLPQNPTYFNPRGYARYYNGQGVNTNYKEYPSNSFRRTGDLPGKRSHDNIQKYRTSQRLRQAPKVPYTDLYPTLTPTRYDEHGNAFNDFVTNYVTHFLYKNPNMKVGKKTKPFSDKWMKDFHSTFDTTNISSGFEPVDGGNQKSSKKTMQDLDNLYNEVGGPHRTEDDDGKQPVLSDEDGLGDGTDGGVEKLIYYVYRHSKRRPSKRRKSSRERRPSRKPSPRRRSSSRGKRNSSDPEHKLHDLGIIPIAYVESKDSKDGLEQPKTDRDRDSGNRRRGREHIGWHHDTPENADNKQTPEPERLQLYKPRDSRAAYGYTSTGIWKRGQRSELPPPPPLHADYQTRKVYKPSQIVDTLTPVDFRSAGAANMSRSYNRFSKY